MVERVKVAEFGIINKQLALATVYIYEADANGESTGTLATLYAASTGVTVRSNPQTLDENGKLQNDVYVATDVVAAISGIGERAERAIRKIRQNPLEFSLPVTSANFYYTNSAADATAAAASAAAAATSETNAATSETNAAASASAASTSASNAATSASNALTSENNASASAAAAAASAAEGLYRDVVTLTNADSPYVPSAAEEGTLFRLDMTSGAIIINLSSLDTYGEDMKFAFAKIDGTANAATVNRGGSDTIAGATSISIDTQYRVHDLIGDITSDTWLNSINAPATAANVAADNSNGSGSTNVQGQLDELYQDPRTWTAPQRGDIIDVAYAASVALNMNDGNNFRIGDLTGNITLANPTNQVEGQSGMIFLTQDGSGNHTITYGTNWLFPDGLEPALSTAAGSLDVLYYFIESNGTIICNLMRAYS